MKRSVLFFVCIYGGLLLSGQSFKITWGDEIKLKKGTADLDIVNAETIEIGYTINTVRDNFFSF